MAGAALCLHDDAAAGVFRVVVGETGWNTESLALSALLSQACAPSVVGPLYAQMRAAK